MYREIKKKKLILENRKPYRKEASLLILELNYIDWIYSSLKLDGSRLKRAEVDKILKGELLTEVSLKDHAVVSNFKTAIDLVCYMVEMEYYLSEKSMFKIYSALTGENCSEYRKSNPVLRMIEYNPPHFKEINQQMEMLYAWLHAKEQNCNPIERAAHLHNRIIEIYPYAAECEAMARMAAQYHLMSNGLPPILWNVGEDEYYDAIYSYLRKDEISPVYNIIERGVFNKLEVMMQLTHV